MLCLGSYGCPRRGSVSFEQATPALCLVESCLIIIRSNVESPVRISVYLRLTELNEAPDFSRTGLEGSVSAPAIRHQHQSWVVRVGGDDGKLRPWHYIYVYSIESRQIWTSMPSCVPETLMQGCVSVPSPATHQHQCLPLWSNH